MSSIPPPSQAGVPTGGNGKYIAVAALLLIGIGGLVVFKMNGSTEPPQHLPIATSATASATTYSQRFDDVPPPPDEDAGFDAGQTKITTTGGSGTAFATCDVKVCNGSAGQDLENGLGMVARQTKKKCYERALGNDPSLQGHVTVSLRIGSDGRVCAANVKSNDMSDPSVASCAANTLLASHLPPPKGGCVNIDFPIAYVPAGAH